ncbi:hypothetical protein [Maritimibacter sp. UBA3975]|uniref:hypothetical protein n=1 Tax=Maritimibacter sp. UBA3975 TaxID=1946833 RepID=UPI000C095C33|nr:hypothetical protein [Maritimibacter sp. UBA3975]MAM63744.1 hypothetical protein [Maritimibacter sp.]|tara:strand:- start:25533 stop:25922 length:390 start_codon:yes stop_codon:yes gene_type:complete
MPLWLLGIIVVVGLTAIWLVMRVYGFDRPLTLTHEVVAQEFAVDNPGLTPEDIHLAKSGQSALVHAGGSTYVLWVMGQDVATHDLAKARVSDAESGLTLRLPDFAAPRVTLTLTEDEKARWKPMIEEAV